MTHDCTEGSTNLVGEPFSGVEEHEDHHLVGGHGDDVFPGAAFRYCASTSTNLVTNDTLNEQFPQCISHPLTNF